MFKPISYILFIIGLFAVSSYSTFAVVNPDFELFQPPLANESFSRPTGWYSYNYVAVQQGFIPQPEHNQALSWQIADSNIIPFKNEYFVLLSTDDIGPDGGEREAYMNQEFIFEKENTIEFYYFFGSCDYMPFGDWAKVELQVYDRAARLILNRKEILRIDVADVNSFGSTNGWQKVEYYLDPNDPNIYNRIEFRVEDYTDAIYKTYFAIDAIRYGWKPISGDVDDNWQVDFVDYSILMDCWENPDCNYPDCNEVNFDDSNSIDVNDFNILIDNWLTGEVLVGG